MCAAEFFLGANSKYGFYSLYEHFVNCDKGDFLWVIKGGPGCGKSSFMRKIAEAAECAGCDVERIRCSGDPASLDGIYIPKKQLAFVDGTAPHITEAKYPGAAGAYLDLGRFYDFNALRSKRSDIAELNRKYKTHYLRGYDCITASAAMGLGDAHLIGPREIELTRRKARRFAAREFGKTREEGLGSEKLRFLSAFSFEGYICRTDTAAALCPKVILADNSFGLGNIYLETLREEAARRNLDFILCPDPIDPDLTEAILLPQLGIACIAGKQDIGNCRHVRLDTMVDKEKLRQRRASLRRAAKLKKGLLLEAQTHLQEAKQLHDQLEAIYNPHVDFAGIYALADSFIEKYF